jgi:hypothetical protein
MSFKDQEPFQAPPSEADQLRNHLDTLKGSIRRDWVRAAEAAMTRDERRELREQITACSLALSAIAKRLEKLDPDRT